MADVTAAPGSFEALKRQISERYPGLPGRLRQIAEFALEHPNDMALGTVAGIAVRAGVQPSSIVRFANALGYDGFSELQQVFRARLIADAPTYRERIAALQGERRPKGRRGQAGAAEWQVLASFVGEGIAELEHLQAAIRPAELARAVSLLAAAPAIHVLGQGRSFPVAFYLNYALCRLDLRAHLIDSLGGMAEPQARTAALRDVLVAVSFKPYSPEVVGIVEASAARGVAVLALTDSALSPIARPAEVAFEVALDAGHPFRSLIAPLCLAQSLVVALGHRLTEGRAQA